MVALDGPKAAVLHRGILHRHPNPDAARWRGIEEGAVLVGDDLSTYVGLLDGKREDWEVSNGNKRAVKLRGSITVIAYGGIVA